MVSLLTWLPLLTGLLLLVWREPGRILCRVVGLAVVLATLGNLAWIISLYDATKGGLQLAQRLVWIPSLEAAYFVGVDGISILFLGMLLLISGMALFAFEPEQKLGRHYGLHLLQLGSLAAVFSSWNFVHWFFAWELALIPAFALIFSSGSGRRVEAATRFLLWGLVGSLPFLAGFLVLFLKAGTLDFDLLTIKAASGTLHSALGETHLLVFGCFVMGALVKLPLLPLHGWQAEAYESSPTGGVLLLSGVLSKMGLYALVRFVLPWFPDMVRAHATLLCTLAIATLFFGMFRSLSDRNIRRIMSHLSLAHVALTALVLFAVGASVGQRKAVEICLSAMMIQMQSHAVLSALGLGLADSVERRAGGRTLGLVGGARGFAQVFSAIFLISALGASGIPPLGAFVGEFLMVKGMLPLAPWAVFCALAGLLLGTWSLLRVHHSLFWGETKGSGFVELTAREGWFAITCLITALLLGIFPGAFLAVCRFDLARIASLYP